MKSNFEGEILRATLRLKRLKRVGAAVSGPVLGDFLLLTLHTHTFHHTHIQIQTTLDPAVN